MKQLIKKITFILFLFGFSSHAFAEWVKLGTSEDGKTTFYWNSPPAQRNGNIVKLWKMADESSPKTYANATYLSSKDLAEYDCANNKFRFVSLYLFKKNMASGEVVYTDGNPSPWIDTPPDSIAEMYAKVACKKR